MSSRLLLAMALLMLALVPALAAKIAIYNYVTNDKGTQQIIKLTCTPTVGVLPVIYLQYGENYKVDFSATPHLMEYSCRFQYDLDTKCQNFAVSKGRDCEWHVNFQGFDVSLSPFNNFVHEYDWYSSPECEP